MTARALHTTFPPAGEAAERLVDAAGALILELDGPFEADARRRLFLRCVGMAALLMHDDPTLKDALPRPARREAQP